MVSDDEIIKLIVKKKEFSELPRKDIEIAFSKFDKEKYGEEEKVKLTRELLRKVFSGVAGKNLLNWKNRDSEDVLKKHLSTRERFENYDEIYSRILRKLPEKISVIDLGCGVNGLSYDFFKKLNKKVEYFGVEAVGQLVNISNDYFKKYKLSAGVIHASLFDLDIIKEKISEMKRPRIVFMFKVIDSLESLERDYTKRFLEEIVPLTDRVIVSFATQSWMKRKTFFVQRTWLTNFIKERWQFIDDFNIGGERYLAFEG